MKQRGTLVRRQLDPRQTQPETPCTARQLLGRRREERMSDGSDEHEGANSTTGEKFKG